MKTIEKKLPVPSDFVIPEGIELQDALFFDIETTGLSRDYHKVYLIGSLCIQDGKFLFCQWLAEKETEEGSVLSSFFSYACRFTTLISFNGNRFDFPFLQSRMSHLGLPCTYKSFQMLDLYQYTKQYKRLLGLENCKQKTLERFLGVFREDAYTGGELISIFKAYEKDPDPHKENLLLLHNEEDVLGMPKLLPILQYHALFSASFHNIRCRIHPYRELTGLPKKELFLEADCSVSVPKPFFVKKEGWYVKADGSRLFFRIPLLETELKHFYEDYQNYYYLPAEDCAIHKSVASYVEKDYRQKATKTNCYTRISGLFFPQPSDLKTPVFYESEKKALCYALYEDTLLQASNFWETYIRQLLKHISGIKEASHNN